MSCIFGFDVGTKLVGVAIGNRLTSSARALAAIAVRDGEPDWVRLDGLQREWQPDTFVVGLPVTLSGEEQPMTRTARRFAARLTERYGVAVAFADERNSSKEAARRFADARAVGLKRKRDAATIDADAAAVILEAWLARE
jgi:putative Holliday junction resolvase